MARKRRYLTADPDVPKYRQEYTLPEPMREALTEYVDQLNADHSKPGIHKNTLMYRALLSYDPRLLKIYQRKLAEHRREQHDFNPTI